LNFKGKQETACIKSAHGPGGLKNQWVGIGSEINCLKRELMMAKFGICGKLLMKFRLFDAQKITFLAEKSFEV